MKTRFTLSLILSLIMSQLASADCSSAYQATSKLRKKERSHILQVLEDVENPYEFKLIYSHDVWERAWSLAFNSKQETATFKFIDEATKDIPGEIGQAVTLRPCIAATILRKANASGLLCESDRKSPMNWDEIVKYTREEVAKADPKMSCVN